MNMTDLVNLRRRNLRLLIERQYANSQSNFSNATGIKLSQIGQWLSDPESPNARNMSDRSARKIERAVRIGSMWMDTEHVARSDVNVEPGPDLAPRPIPLISWVQAGDWNEAINSLAPGDAEEWLFITGHSRPHAYALRVRGISMEPDYQSGDIILVDRDLQAINGSHVVVQLDTEKEATFKRLVIEGDRKFLQPLNPAWPDKMIEINGNATICGVVFAMMRYR